MLNNSTKLMFFMTLTSGIFLAVSSNSWMGAWMGLEINLLSFIPMMTNNENIYTTEASMKYFLVQALASSLLLFVIITATIMEQFQLINKWLNYNNLMMTPLLLKSGIAPFHWWFPSVMEGLGWINCLILMTLQSIAPMILMSNIISVKLQFSLIVLMSVLVGSLGGLNQISLRKMLAYSSINHMGWLLMSLLISNNVWMMYFMTYSILLMTVISIFNTKKISFINQVTSVYDIPTFKFMIFMSLLSLGGLPPFMGFFPKWVVIQFMVCNKFMIMATMMVVFSLITLYYYLRITYSAFLILHVKISWKKYFFNKNLMNLTTLVLISTVGLIIMSLPTMIYL
uniref:NADH dehydrogenase subunit 2 n=1 Tax=Balta maculata TaxID=3037036 RepID=UPI0027A3E2D7|nr:NADH dehydrogenase subunit 2 [Balta maculata]WGO57132.1 NADH dehydrogenase subunit 2 [Balta maculata]